MTMIYALVGSGAGILCIGAVIAFIMVKEKKVEGFVITHLK